MAPITQTSDPWPSHRQIPTLLVNDASVVESNLDFGEIISVCEFSGFDIKISIAASEKLIDYDLSPKRQSSPSEEAQLSNLLSKIISVGSRNSYDTKISISTLKTGERTEEAGFDNPCYEEEDDEDDDEMSFRLSPRNSYHSLSVSSVLDWTPLNMNASQAGDEVETEMERSITEL